MPKRIVIPLNTLVSTYLKNNSIITPTKTYREGIAKSIVDESGISIPVSNEFDIVIELKIKQ